MNQYFNQILFKICCNFAVHLIKCDITMAQPIKETPILEGNDAIRFVERMNETRTESAEKKRRRLANYKLAISIMVNK